MCGIYCCIVHSSISACNLTKDIKTQELLKRRGPDRSSSCDVQLLNWTLHFKSYILWMQGNEPVVQPVKDDDGNLLLWNGDIFSGIYEESSTKMGVSDASVLLHALAQNESSPVGVLETMMNVNGPWSMIYWNKTNKILWFGRDVLGRHSLLWSKSGNGIILTSVAKRGYDEEEFQEVPAIGLFSMDFNAVCRDQEYPDPILHFWTHLIPANITITNKTPIDQILGNNCYYNLPFSLSKYTIKPPLEFKSCIDIALEENKYLSDERVLSFPPLEALNALADLWQGMENILERFIELLKEAVKTRVQIQPGLCKNCIKGVSKIEGRKGCPHSKICVLFSGGIDSTVIALLADLFVPEDEAIDLLNVAFSSENIAQGSRDGSSKQSNDKDELKECSTSKMPVQLQRDMFEVPDRKTGKQALAELKALCPNRKWNFVEIDVHVSELSHTRQGIITDLINPLNTVLDDSLGCAMWFAARGSGTVIVPAESGETDSQRVPYTSSARIALLGTGADEQLGGYSRHRSALEDGGWSLLSEEMLKQLKNLPSRNLGRDDRICSDHGRQPRFPFLDEAVVSFLSSLAPWQKVAAQVDTRKKKVNLRNKESNHQKVPLTVRPGVGDKALLRLVALKLGLKDVCSFPKRAMQFGSRIAKLEGKEKANYVCQRLMSSKISD